VRVRPAARDQLTVPAQQGLRLDGESLTRRPAAVSDSTLPATPDQPASTSAAELADATSRVSWRSTRISSSFDRRGRDSSQTSANRFRTTRYANDQSKPALLNDDGKNLNLARWP
jgi:hypothetical protein